MKNQALFSPKDKSKKLKCRPLQFLFGALRVNTYNAFRLNVKHSMANAMTLITDIFHNILPALSSVLDHPDLVRSCSTLLG